MRTFRMGSKTARAVPHNSAMLRLERDIAERVFRRADGAMVIVATPTLAQGLNLPAHFAILAGDKRTDSDRKKREDLEAHEILNAAARAGRAGHLANGVVLLVPEPIITYKNGKPLEHDALKKLKLVLPEDHRCVDIDDPLEVVLDRLMDDNQSDPDVRYIINRMIAFREAEGAEEPTHIFDLRKSLGAFRARQNAVEFEFEAKIESLKRTISEENSAEIDDTLAILASQSGLSTSLLQGLKARVVENIGSLPTDIEGWLTWTVDWLVKDENARSTLLSDVRRSLLGAVGRKKDKEISAKELQDLLPGVIAWIQGKPLSTIEKILGGEPDSPTTTKKHCPRARELVGAVIPRGLSFIVGLISHVVDEVRPYEEQGDLSQKLVECLSTAIRKGFDVPEKLYFAGDNPELLGRVQAHKMWDVLLDHDFEA